MQGVSMKDCKGVELKVGDFVVFIKGYKSDAHLETGWVYRIRKGLFHEETCCVQDAQGIKIKSDVRSDEVMKL